VKKARIIVPLAAVSAAMTFMAAGPASAVTARTVKPASAVSSGTASPSAVRHVGAPLGDSTVTSARPAALECSKAVMGSTGYADCTGDETWRLAVYCDFPSVSPVYSGYVNGTGSASATCWFGASAQYAAIEVVT
jgi:hypothetical protein